MTESPKLALHPPPLASAGELEHSLYLQRGEDDYYAKCGCLLPTSTSKALSVAGASGGRKGKESTSRFCSALQNPSPRPPPPPLPATCSSFPDKRLLVTLGRGEGGGGRWRGTKVPQDTKFCRREMKQRPPDANFVINCHL